MKYVLVIGDGMADTRLPQLAGKTPLEALALPAFDRCAGCFCGRALTVPHGMPAGSDTAILSIFGYAPQTYYTGRSVLEAAGMGVTLPEGAISFRVNLCAVLPGEDGRLVIHSHNGGNIHGEEATTPVSYTHLDVYKRQGIYVSRLSCWRAPCYNRNRSSGLRLLSAAGHAYFTSSAALHARQGSLPHACQ